MAKAKLNFNVNPALIKERLNRSSKSKISYFKVSKDKTQTIKLVPFTEGNDLGIAIEEGYPILEVRQHYPLKDYFPGKYKKIISPMTFGLPDPILDMYFDLRTQNSDNLEDESVKAFLQPLEGKSRYYSFVLHETDSGNELKLWSYPYGTYKTLLEYISDPDTFGDILDPDGHFITVKMDGDNRTNVNVRPKPTQLTESDIDLIMNQPSLEKQFQYESTEELTRILSSYLSEDVEEEDEIDDEDVVEEEESVVVDEKPKSITKPKTVETEAEPKAESKVDTPTTEPVRDRAEFKKLFNKNKK